MTYKEFIEIYKIKLNNQQQTAVGCLNKATLLLAVPGSGKTTVIVTRIGYLMLCHDVLADNILTVTFSVSATNDMKLRFATVFPELYSNSLQFRTIHGFCSLVIRKYEQMYNRTAFNLIGDDGGVAKIIRNLFKEITGNFPTENNISDIMQGITYCKNMMLTDEEVKKYNVNDIDFFEIYKAYREYKIANKLMDYDDQLEYAYKILKGYPQILQYYQRKYKYINVDEAQDTSKIQHEIIKLLVGEETILFMVGDEDQSIYGFRAAYPRALLDFKKTYSDAQVLLMEKNYRSTKQIVNHANDFIKLNHERYDKNMVTDNEEGQAIKHTVLEDYKHQYDYIYNKAVSQNEETAVLYRNNESAIPLIDLFEINNINFRIKENSALFFTHFIVLDIINIIKFAFEPCNVDLFMKIYYKMGFIINKKTALFAVNEYQKYKDKPLLDYILEQTENEAWQYKRIASLRLNLEMLTRDDAVNAIDRIVNDLNYQSYIQSRNCDMSKVNIIKAIASRTTDIDKFLKRIEFLEEFIKKGNGTRNSNFILSTIHSSKGLEYDNVILLDIRDDIMPGFSYTDEKDLLQEDRDILEEERRLFYVATTRAKTTLEIISAKKHYGKLVETPKFIKQFLHINEDKKKSKIFSNISECAKAICKSNSNTNVDIKTQIKFKVGTRINHRFFGEGEVIQLDDKIITIHCFNDGIIRSFDFKACIKNKLFI